ncbi:response regulator [Desulfobacterales bacterium HSG16]|nr:response regulator [Desulfobacterales bacterium HSG16]
MMKNYHPQLLTAWDSDSTSSHLIPDSGAKDSGTGSGSEIGSKTGLETEKNALLFFDDISKEFDWIESTVRGIEQNENEDIFDELYRRSHILYGFADIFNIPKICHLLAILDFVVDYARKTQTLNEHSLKYLISLIIETTGKSVDEYKTDRLCSIDLHDVVEECANYLQKLLEHENTHENNAEMQKSVSHDEKLSETEESSSSKPRLQAMPSLQAMSSLQTGPGFSEDAAIEPPFDDEPEPLNVPVNKVGMISIFCEECRESLIQVGNQLIELENSNEPVPVIHEIFRLVHTVKGGARLLKVQKIEYLTHHLETLLDRLRKKEIEITPTLIDLLLDSRKCIEEMVEDVASKGPVTARTFPFVEKILEATAGIVSPDMSKPAIHEIPLKEKPALKKDEATPENALKKLVTTVTDRQKSNIKTTKPLLTDTIRLATHKLDEVLNTASEIFISRIRLQNDIAAIGNSIKDFKTTIHHMEDFAPEEIMKRLAESNNGLLKDIEVILQKQEIFFSEKELSKTINRFHDELIEDMTENEVVIPEEMRLNVLSIEEICKRLRKNTDDLEHLSSRLLSGAMSFRMVPIASLFERFPTQVRETARQVGKKIRLDISGADTELDKILINQLVDPLLHILRNSIDHGIETTEERLRRNKPESGRISLKAYYQGSHAIIEITDDGKGIDPDAIQARAIEHGLIEPQAAESLNKNQILDFLFEPGFSTVEKTTRLSGRGVGMDVVKSAIKQIQGSINIDTALGQGTSLKIKLPLTLAVVEILLVQEGPFQFAFPIIHVEEILHINKEDINQLSCDMVYNLRGNTLPITTLSNVFKFPPSTLSDTEIPLIVLSEGEKKVGVLVDTITGRQEVLIKDLGTLIKKIPYIMGCTVLSDSRLVMVLNAWEFVNYTENLQAEPLRGKEKINKTRQNHSILIIDDSAIHRKNLHSAFNRAGYSVGMAENGFNALKDLRNKNYSLFCVDVIMPVMDGFEFVERLRQLPMHKNTPVFFISAKTTDTDHERARQLGVNEYYNKPVDTAVLIEAIDNYLGIK